MLLKCRFLLAGTWEKQFIRLCCNWMHHLCLQDTEMQQSPLSESALRGSFACTEFEWPTDKDLSGDGSWIRRVGLPLLFWKNKSFFLFTWLLISNDSHMTRKIAFFIEKTSLGPDIGHSVSRKCLLLFYNIFHSAFLTHFVSGLQLLSVSQMLQLHDSDTVHYICNSNSCCPRLPHGLSMLPLSPFS